MRFTILLSLVASAFAANNYVDEMSIPAHNGTSLSSFALTAGQSTCYPQQGASAWLATEGYTCTIQLFTSADCTGTAYDERVNSDAEDSCVNEQGTGGSFLVTC